MYVKIGNKIFKEEDVCNAREKFYDFIDDNPIIKHILMEYHENLIKKYKQK